MSNQINFEYDGVKYTLEFTRATVRQMEKSGFKANELGDFPMTYLPDLFAGSFLAHHKWIKPEKVDEIYKKFTNKQELVGKLAEMYNAPIKELFEEPEEDEGNVAWTANW